MERARGGEELTVDLERAAGGSRSRSTTTARLPARGLDEIALTLREDAALAYERRTRTTIALTAPTSDVAVSRTSGTIAASVSGPRCAQAEPMPRAVDEPIPLVLVPHCDGERVRVAEPSCHGARTTRSVVTRILAPS